MSGPDSRIPVAVLGATGAVGQRLVSLLEGHPQFVLAEVAASERSAGTDVRRGDALDPAGRHSGGGAGTRRDARGRGLRLAGPPLGSRRGRRRHDRAPAGRTRQARRLEHEVLPDASRRAARDPGGERGPPRAARRAAQPRVRRRHRDESELLRRRPRDGARAARTAPSGSRRVAVTTMQALSGAGYPGRSVPRRERERDPVHRRRGGEDRARAEEDPRPARGGPRRGRGLPDQRVREPRARARRPHGVRLRQASGEGRPSRTCGGRSRSSRASPSD